VLLAASMAVGTTGCGPKRAAAPLVNTGLESLGDGASPIPARTPSYNQAQLEKLAAESLDLQKVLTQMPQPEPARRDTEPAPPQPAVAAAPPPPVEPVVVNPPPAPPKPLATRIDETSMMLVDLLTQQAATESSPRAYLALAGLEFLRPGSLPGMITPTSTDSATISPEEMRAVAKLRDYLAAIGKPDDTRPLAERIAAHLDVLTATCPLSIRTVQLCTDVAGFGQYTPLGVDRFIHGRAIRAVVYVEVDHFAHREVNESDRTAAKLGGRDLEDRWAVELSQELKLYHAADDVLVWSRPAQAVVETSRNKRRDFYLVHTVSLPSTLSLGSYTLKVIIRDRVSGEEKDVNIPFEIVADATLAAERSGP
jgi:hypothetical protein